MSQKLSYFLFLFLCFSLNTFLNAQTQHDSLAKYSFKEIEKKFYDTRFTDKNLCKLYAEKYLSKAKLSGDKVKISRGYFHMAIFYYVVSNKDLLSIQYTDSIIETCKTCKNKDFPAMGYYTKGAYQYDLGMEKKALNNFLETLKILKINNNVRLELKTRNAIISTNSNWIADDKTLKYLLELLNFLKKQKNYNEEYAQVISNLSIEYGRRGNYKKQLEYAKLGIDEKLQGVRSPSHYNFVAYAGTAQYYLENYEATIDSSLKALPHLIKINDRDVILRYYYIAKSYDKLKQFEKAQFYFLKTDSIYQATKDIYPEMRIAYEYIIDYYKSKNDAENQIKYYDRLLEVDKIIDSAYTYVKETIEKKFDTPQAIAERARLVEALETKKNAWKYRFGAISAILLVILGILVAAFRRQKYYKKRFENIMSIERISTPLNASSDKRKRDVSIQQSESAEAFESQKIEAKDLGVPKEIIESILNQLKKFEDTKKFTKQVSITSLAKNLKTNPKYLSKVINWHYKKNFSQYISELRIEYVISRLKEDSKFRNYTIKAIAKEAGFGNTESFSKAFHKSTGIKPSYFIKELQKRLES
ncbi:helix-turn-helix domain-containing protein [Kordia sp.]|uniref:helix-turn-helix domain-containing protein n=1 Tax=Kordia sp. TaxID=1965332 RepID=UPI003D6C4BD0